MKEAESNHNKAEDSKPEFGRWRGERDGAERSEWRGDRGDRPNRGSYRGRGGDRPERDDREPRGRGGRGGRGYGVVKKLTLGRS